MRGRIGVLWLALAMLTFPFAPSAQAATTVTEGTIWKLMSDRGEPAETSLRWVLHTSDGRYLPAGPVRGAASGDKVSIRNLRLVRGKVSSASLAGAVRVAPGVRASKLEPQRRLTVVPVSGDGMPWTTEDEAAVRRNLDNLVPWWGTMSGGRERLSYSVVSPISVGATLGDTDACGSFVASAAPATAYLKSLGVLASTTNLAVVAPMAFDDCRWAGMATVGGNLLWMMNGGNGYEGVWAHELGHNLGFPHGNVCRGSVPLTYLSTCQDVEYGNYLDVMGIGPAASINEEYFSPTFLRAAGWLPDSAVSVWSGSAAEFVVNRPERSDTGVTSVRIPATDPSAGDNTFWLQYQPQAAGGRRDGPSTNGGVVITMEPSPDFAKTRVASNGKVGYANSDSYLCDISRPAGSSLDGRLYPGESYTDPRNRFTVKVLSVDGSRAVVRVEPVAQPVVLPAVAVSAVPAESGARRIEVGITPSAPGANEPTQWLVDTLEDPTRTCVVPVWRTGCALTGLTRGVSYTVRVVATNGSARAAPVTGPPVQVNITAPTFDVSLTSTSDSVTAKVSLEDGGSPITDPAVLTVAGRPPCTVSVGDGRTCTFTGLKPRTVHEVVAAAGNAVGRRESRFSVRTKVAKPVSPAVKGAFEGNDLVIGVTADERDATNATDARVWCFARSGSSDQYLSLDLPLDPATRFARFVLPGVKGLQGTCTALVLAQGEEEGDWQASDGIVVEVTASGRIVVTRIDLRVTVVSRTKGKVQVKWWARGPKGSLPVSVRISRGKKCISTGPRSCEVRGQKSGSTVAVVVNTVFGWNSATVRRTVVVK
jgi:hypothetical protein